MLCGACASVVVAEAAAAWSPLGIVTGAAWQPDSDESAKGSLRSMNVQPEPNADGQLKRLASVATPLLKDAYTEQERAALPQTVFMQRGTGLEYETFVMGQVASGMPIASVYGVRAGWPLRCLCAYRYSVVSGGNSRMIVEPYWVGAVELPKWAHAQPGAWNLPRRMVVSPLWAGLAVNSLFFACVIGAPVWCVRALRRRYRVRRGMCVGCGYRLAGLAAGPCPECGRGRDAA
ncbi:MAG: hypothetical protein QM783_01245 [Phycisphaerales bacterium]